MVLYFFAALISSIIGELGAGVMVTQFCSSCICCCVRAFLVEVQLAFGLMLVKRAIDAGGVFAVFRDEKGTSFTTTSLADTFFIK